MCWKKTKDGKSHSGAANFLEVLLNDKEATLQQLNKLCGNENIFSYTRVPMRRMPIEVAPASTEPSPEATGEGTRMNRENSVRSKINALTTSQKGSNVSPSKKQWKKEESDHAP